MAGLGQPARLGLKGFESLQAHLGFGQDVFAHLGAGLLGGSLAHQGKDLAVLVGGETDPLRPPGGGHCPVTVDVAAGLTQDCLAARVVKENRECVMEVAAELQEPVGMLAEKVHLVYQSLQLVELLSPDGAGDLLDDCFLEDGAQPEEIADVFGVDVGDYQAAAGPAFGKPLCLELPQRLPQWRTADRQRDRQVGLDEAGLGREPTVGDLIAENLGRGLRRRPPLDPHPSEPDHANLVKDSGYLYTLGECSDGQAACQAATLDVRGSRQVSNQLQDRFQDINTCDISDALDSMDLQGQVHGLAPLWPGAPAVVGPALTMKLHPQAKYSTVIGTLEGIAAGKAGDVIVFDNDGRTDINTFGSIAAYCARKQGIVGCITDGASRDVDGMQQDHFPIYGRGTVTTSVRDRTGFVGYQVPVRIGGVDVNPGDIVMADINGAVVIPADRLEEAIRMARFFREMERRVKAAVDAGGSPVEVHENLKYDRLFSDIRAEEMPDAEPAS